MIQGCYTWTGGDGCRRTGHARMRAGETSWATLVMAGRARGGKGRHLFQGCYTWTRAWMLGRRATANGSKGGTVPALAEQGRDGRVDPRGLGQRGGRRGEKGVI